MNLNKLQGISFYKNRNGFLEHSFYKKNSDTFIKVNDLTLKTSKIALLDIDFIVEYSNLITNQLTVYTVLNPIYNNSSFGHSNDFRDFMAWNYGSKVGFTKSVDTSSRVRPYEGKCGHCKEQTRGDCMAADGSWCDPYICQYSKSQTILSQNSESIEMFDNQKTYEIRDELLSNSFIGNKYMMYYYRSSFSDLNFSVEQSVSLSKLLPKIYSGFNSFKNNNSNVVLIDDSFASEIIEEITKIKSNNQDKIYFIKILDDIVVDVNYLKNKNVETIKSKMY